MLRFITAAIVSQLVLCVICDAMGPPPGPKNKALCPVTGANITIDQSTDFVAFKNGQKLYFSSKNAAWAYKTNPRDFWLAPHDMPLPGDHIRRIDHNHNHHHRACFHSRVLLLNLQPLALLFRFRRQARPARSAWRGNAVSLFGRKLHRRHAYSTGYPQEWTKFIFLLLWLCHLLLERSHHRLRLVSRVKRKRKQP